MNDSPTSDCNQNMQSEQASTQELKYYLQKADWTLSRLFAFLFNAAIFLFLLIISLASLILELINIFEYQEGLADISIIEIMFSVCLFMLLKRYWAYTKQTSLRWWDILTSPFIWYGKFILFAFFCASLVAFFDLYNGSEYYKIILLQGQSYDQISSFSAILLSLYIAVPSQSLITKPEIQPYHSEELDKPETTKIEPEVENVQ